MENKAESINTTNTICEKESLRNEQSAITTADILSRIDMIVAQGNDLQNVVTQIQNLPVNDSYFGGNDGAEHAKAISNIYSAREVTNQKVIGLLNQMYDDIAPNQPANNAIERISEMNFNSVFPDTAKVILDFIEKKA